MWTLRADAWGMLIMRRWWSSIAESSSRFSAGQGSDVLTCAMPCCAGRKVVDDSDEDEPAASYDAPSPSPAVAQKQVGAAICRFFDAATHPNFMTSNV